MKSSIELVEKTQPLENKVHNLQEHKVLLIEQDCYLNKAFSALLSQSVYQIDKVPFSANIRAALEDYLLKYNPDMIVLDLGFSDSTELMLIRDIRTLYQGLVVVMSNKSCEQEQLDAFKLGVDDYLCKPLDNRILMMRIAALFRRKSDRVKSVELASITLGDICLQPKSQKCFVKGAVVKLTNFEFNLLKELVENQGQILSRDQLYFILLSRTYNGVERTLDVRMSQLREKLTQAGMEKNQIETIWGQGYMFNNLSA